LLESLVDIHAKSEFKTIVKIRNIFQNLDRNVFEKLNDRWLIEEEKSDFKMNQFNFEFVKVIVNCKQINYFCINFYYERFIILIIDIKSTVDDNMKDNDKFFENITC
jgi:hypothetical protein